MRGKYDNVFQEDVIEKLERIAVAQEGIATANAEFQRAIIAAFTPLIPAMLAMFSQSFAMPKTVPQPVMTIAPPRTDGK